MAPSKDPSPERQSSSSSTDLAQAYQDLARGEQAATALEANLNNLENKLDALLAAMGSVDEQKTKSKSPKVVSRAKAVDDRGTESATGDKGDSASAASS